MLHTPSRLGAQAAAAVSVPHSRKGRLKPSALERVLLMKNKAEGLLSLTGARLLKRGAS